MSAPKRNSEARAPDAAQREGADLGRLRAYIGFQLRRSQDLSFQTFSKRVGARNLRPGVFAILAVIGENPGVNQTALGAAVGRDKSTLTPALRDLEKQGMVVRTRSSIDRRAYELNLTTAGEEQLRILEAHAKAHDRLLDSIVGEIHKPLFIHLLETLVSGLTRELEEQELQGR